MPNSISAAEIYTGRGEAFGKLLAGTNQFRSECFARLRCIPTWTAKDGPAGHGVFSISRKDEAFGEMAIPVPKS